LIEDVTSILERKTDDQDGTKQTTEHPIEENKHKKKPNIKNSHGSKGKSSILSTFYLRKAFSPSQSHIDRLYLVSPPRTQVVLFVIPCKKLQIMQG
jgi:hypothetical protein